MPEPYDREPTPESWDSVAVEAGYEGFIGLFRALCETVPDEMIDPASIALLGDAARRRLPHRRAVQRRLHVHRAGVLRPPA